MTFNGVQPQLGAEEYTALAGTHGDPLYPIIGMSKGRADTSSKVDEIDDKD